MNRIKRIEEGSQSRDFNYDAFGNMWVPTTSTGFARESFTPATSAWFDANDRLANPALGVQHDNAGNLTAIGGFLYEYNADGMMTKATPSIGSATEYRYDGEGRRVTKQTGTEPVTTFVYDAFGGLAAEYGTAPTETGTHYITADHLGSTRLVTDATGAVISRHDYLPFGEEIGADGTTRTTAMKYVLNEDLTQRFTGKERDTETGLDYFGARYFSGVMGRFTSADAPFSDQHAEDPQSWNLYGYVRNNPLKYRDPDGRVCIFGLGNTCKEDIEPPPAPKPPPAAPTNPVFPTVDAAAAAAARVNQSGQKKSGSEHGSSVHTLAGGVAFTFTDPVTQDRRTRVDPHNTTGIYSPKTYSILEPPIPPGEVLVAETHSHPDILTETDGSLKQNEQQLSFGDKNRSHALAKFHPSFQGQYVGLRDGRVIKYDPRAPVGRRVSEVQ